MNYQSLILRVREALTPDLLKPKYRKDAIGKCREYGHCYIAAEALWHLVGGSKSGFTPTYGIDDGEDTHWWLVKGSEILDPTAPQYTTKDLKTLYKKGIRCGFLTRQPSKRAQILIDRVKK